MSVPIFPQLHPRTIEPLWYCPDKDRNDVMDIDQIEADHQNWINNVNQRCMDEIPLGTPIEAPTPEDDDDDDDDDDDEEEDETDESHDNDNEEAVYNNGSMNGDPIGSQKYSIEKQEQEYSNLKRRFELMVDQLSSNNFDENVLNDLEIQNTKLKHRLAVLTQAIADEKSSSNVSTKANNSALEFSSPREILRLAFVRAVTSIYPSVLESAVTLTPAKAKFGDYQCNVALQICKLLKESGENVTARIIAQKIVDVFDIHDIVEKLEVAGAGFINIWLNNEFVCSRIKSIIFEGCQPPSIKKKLKVVVDFSSPNVAKEMHVGHLRSTIIGDSICKLLEYLGHDVLRLNHIGDWGTQFGMLIAHLQDMYPNYRTESPSVDNLQRFYKESKVRFDTDEAFKKRAYECVVKLQSFSPDYIKAWQLICDASRKEFQKIYDRLDVRLEERGESFYQKKMQQLVSELEEQGLLENDEGRKIIWGSDSKDNIPLTVVKSDGGFTYDTSDLTAFKQRISEEEADWIIYVTDEGQATHFQVMAECAKRVGFYDPERVRMDFVGFGVVLGEDKRKFKTRSGDTVRLVELLDEGLGRANAKLREKNRHTVLTEEELNAAAEAVAYGCIKYADLSHNRNHVYVFSFDKMLDDKGNTAVYLLYMYTRIKSICRSAQLDENTISNACKTEPLQFSHEKEWKLAKMLLQFSDIIDKITKDLYMHKLCEFLYEVATMFSEFYDNCYCIERDEQGSIKQVHTNRLILCEATAIVMKQCFDILGMKTVSRM